MSNPFAQPSAGGDQFTPAEYNGRLLLVYPKSYEANFETKHGTSDAVTCDVVVVDNPGGAKPLLDAMIFGNLARSVKNAVGGVVLGRLGQGVNTKGNPPWQLNKFTDEDGELARPVHDSYERGELRGGAGAPASDPWATTPTAQPASAWAPAPAPAAAPPNGGSATGVDPKLVEFLVGKGLSAAQVAGFSPEQAALIARTL